MTITQEQLKEMLIYEPETGVFTWTGLPARRGVAKAGVRAGYIDNRGYRRITVACQEHLEHRLAWLYVHGHFPPSDLDHKNGKRDDNRFNNLRPATDTQNQANKCLAKNNTSGFKGVCRASRSTKWEAKIKVRGRVIHLGIFLTAEEGRIAGLREALEICQQYKERHSRDGLKASSLLDQFEIKSAILERVTALSPPTEDK